MSYELAELIGKKGLVPAWGFSFPASLSFITSEKNKSNKRYTWQKNTENDLTNDKCVL